MANTTTAAANVVTIYDSKLFREYVRGNGFDGYIGSGTDSPIVIKEEGGSKIISIPFVTKPNRLLA